MGNRTKSQHTGAKNSIFNAGHLPGGVAAAKPLPPEKRPNSATAASDKMQMIRDEQRAAEKPVYGCQTREEWLPGWLGEDVVKAMSEWRELWTASPSQRNVRGWPRNVSKPERYTQEYAEALALSIATVTEEKPAILPQSLQSAAEVLIDAPTAPVKRKSPTVARKHDKPVLEMAEALQYAIEHWDDVDAHRLPGNGYLVYKSPQRPAEQQIPEEKMGSYWIWRHRNLANRVVVGMRDLNTGQPAYVAPLDDIADYMTKAEKAAKSGVPPFSTSTNSTDGKRSRRGVPVPAGLATVNS